MTQFSLQELRSRLRKSFYSYVVFRSLDHGKKNALSRETFKPVADWLQSNAINNVPRQAYRDPRNHLKTTFVRLFIEWRSIQRPHPDFDSPAEVDRALRFLDDHPQFRGQNERLLYAGGSKENATKQIRAAAATYQYNDRFRALFRELTPEYFAEGEKMVWNADEFLLPGRTVNYPESFLTAAGTTSRSTGAHFNGIVFDDPVNENNWKSVPEITAAIDWLLFAENLLETADTSAADASWILLNGNIWTAADVSTFVEDNLKSYVFFHRSCWVCEEHGRGNCGRERSACQKTEEPLWPDRWTTEGLLRLKREQKQKFSAQYENDPLSGEDVPFDLADLRDCAYDKTSNEVLVFQPGSRQIERRVPLGALRGVVSIDPASSTDPRSCRSAIALLAEDRETQAVYFLDLDADRYAPSDVIENTISMYAKWRLRGLYIAHVGVEVVAGQKYFIPALIAAAKNPQRDFISPDHREKFISLLAPLTVQPNKQPEDVLQEYKTDRNIVKEERITGLLDWRVKSGLLYVNVALPGLALFHEEFSRHPLGKSNDVLDALAYPEQIYERLAIKREQVDKARQALLRRVHRRAGGLI